MAAIHTLPHPSAVSQIPKHGVLTLYGYGIRVAMQNGHLAIEHGTGAERQKFRLARVGHGMRRLVLIGNDGFVTLEALRWISEIGASFVMLDKRGKVIIVCGPNAPSEARLRRAQALALGNGTALRISKELISQKLDGQAAVARDLLRNPAAANAIAQHRAKLPEAETSDRINLIEAQAAKLYWQAWSGIPVCWPRKDEQRVPEHWKYFGSRISPLTRSPRLATNPPNAILNLLYSILEAECRLAAAAMGLDPGLGLLHKDTANRDSLACDFQEPVRASVDAFVLNWIQTELLSKADFFEDRNGNCRLVSSLVIKLCETAATWRKLVAPVAEYVAKQLWNTCSRATPSEQQMPTRLTQSRKREVKGSTCPKPQSAPRPHHVCRACGTPISRRHDYCGKCAVAVWRLGMTEAAKVGRIAAHSPEAKARRIETKRRHDAARRSWRPSDNPAWLNEETYQKRIEPRLGGITVLVISSSLSVSEPYAADIRAGKRQPHPRHWPALARLTGVSEQ
jgi:CRISPR-associated endonuclease Cas1